jgi:5-methylcytosine-specific restriction endonuclease McrA
MRASVPDGDLGVIIEAAVTEKLERLEARRFAATDRPRQDLSKVDTSPASRRIPAAVRRAVHERDGGRCRYVDADGRRCPARDHLEYHHLRPFGFGGDHRLENVRLMCRAHNAYLAERDFGRAATGRFKPRGHPANGAQTRAPAGPAAAGSSGPQAVRSSGPQAVGSSGPRAVESSEPRAAASSGPSP